MNQPPVTPPAVPIQTQTKPSRPWWRRAGPPLLAASVVGLLGFLLLKPAPTSPSGQSGSSLIGQPAPGFSLSGLDGETVSLAGLRGQPVVLNFWASWCGPCREEAPIFREVAGRVGAGQQVAVVGVLFQETSEQSARQFLQDYGLKYPNLIDPGLNTGVAYRVSGIPHTVFIDRAGVVQHLERGGLTPERMNIGLEKIGVEKISVEKISAEKLSAAGL